MKKATAAKRKKASPHCLEDCVKQCNDELSRLGIGYEIAVESRMRIDFDRKCAEMRIVLPMPVRRVANSKRTKAKPCVLPGYCPFCGAILQ